mmetsp:Transcript_73672/g.163740  ORF Transcript_73672/g.163740 Transcript_73672/m.163740 type:complete len:246 (-) Transcript_73672:281-1018(-)
MIGPLERPWFVTPAPMQVMRPAQQAPRYLELAGWGPPPQPIDVPCGRQRLHNSPTPVAAAQVVEEEHHWRLAVGDCTHAWESLEAHPHFERTHEALELRRHPFLTPLPQIECHHPCVEQSIVDADAVKAKVRKRLWRQSRPLLQRFHLRDGREQRVRPPFDEHRAHQPVHITEHQRVAIHPKDVVHRWQQRRQIEADVAVHRGVLDQDAMNSAENGQPVSGFEGQRITWRICPFGSAAGSLWQSS